MQSEKANEKSVNVCIQRNLSLYTYTTCFFRLVEEKTLAAAVVVVDSEERKLAAAAVVVVDLLAPELILHRNSSIFQELVI